MEASGSGIGLYEASANSCAVAGTVIGKAIDASANFYNPATLSDLTNYTISVGFVTEHPRCRIKVDGNKSSTMDPGAFIIPSVQTAVPLPWGFTFGLGILPEYGLGSEYSESWELRGNSTDTTVMSFTVNPNLSYAITEDWSIGAGARLLYFDFEQHSRPYGYRQRLKGDNDMSSCGWQVGTRYRILKNLSAGLVYKSWTDVNVKGKSRMNVSYPSNGRAETDLELPQSVTGGLNWDVTDKIHLGASVAWTEWSCLDKLDFHLGSVHKPIYLKWEDTWRFGLGGSWDFVDDWTALCGYCYETDCCGDQLSTMLPASDRHMLNFGLSWHVGWGFDLSLYYGLIIMDGNSTHSTDESGKVHEYCAHRGLSHAAGFTVTYSF